MLSLLKSFKPVSFVSLFKYYRSSRVEWIYSRRRTTWLSSLMSEFLSGNYSEVSEVHNATQGALRVIFLTSARSFKKFEFAAITTYRVAENSFFEKYGANYLSLRSKHDYAAKISNFSVIGLFRRFIFETQATPHLRWTNWKTSNSVFPIKGSINVASRRALPKFSKPVSVFDLNVVPLFANFVKEISPRTLSTVVDQRSGCYLSRRHVSFKLIVARQEAYFFSACRLVPVVMGLKDRLHPQVAIFKAKLRPCSPLAGVSAFKFFRSLNLLWFTLFRGFRFWRLSLVNLNFLTRMRWNFCIPKIVSLVLGARLSLFSFNKPLQFNLISHKLKTFSELERFFLVSSQLLRLNSFLMSKTLFNFTRRSAGYLRQMAVFVPAALRFSAFNALLSRLFLSVTRSSYKVFAYEFEHLLRIWAFSEWAENSIYALRVATQIGAGYGGKYEPIGYLDLIWNFLFRIRFPNFILNSQSGYRAIGVYFFTFSTKVCNCFITPGLLIDEFSRRMFNTMLGLGFARGVYYPAYSLKVFLTELLFNHLAVLRPTSDNSRDLLLFNVSEHNLAEMYHPVRRIFTSFFDKSKFELFSRFESCQSKVFLYYERLLREVALAPSSRFFHSSNFIGQRVNRHYEFNLFSTFEVVAGLSSASFRIKLEHRNSQFSLHAALNQRVLQRILSIGSSVGYSVFFNFFRPYYDGVRIAGQEVGYLFSTSMFKLPHSVNTSLAETSNYRFFDSVSSTLLESNLLSRVSSVAKIHASRVFNPAVSLAFMEFNATGGSLNKFTGSLYRLQYRVDSSHTVKLRSTLFLFNISNATQFSKLNVCGRSYAVGLDRLTLSGYSFAELNFVVSIIEEDLMSF